LANKINTNWFMDADEEAIFTSKLRNDWAFANMKKPGRDKTKYQKVESKKKIAIKDLNFENW